MSKDYTQKIRSILNQSTQTVPYIFERFYTLLKKITLSLGQENNEPKLFQQYSLIFRTVKKYIKDESYLLVNNLEKIEKQLKNLIVPLLIQLQQDVLSRKILQYFADKETNLQITKFISSGDKIRQQLAQKNVKIKVFGTHQMSNAFWIGNFKNEYAVHFDLFWNSFLQFIGEINFFEYFISSSSKRSVMRVVDPTKKYFITSSNVSQLFYKLSEPQYLQRLADETAKGPKSLNFVSKDFLELEFYPNSESHFETDLIETQIFQISGEDTFINQKRSKCKYQPTVIFGSSLDSDVKIKNKYVSRKQFMIIQEDQDQKRLAVGSKILPFSLVCLSSSNFTMVGYERKQKMRTGMIFKVGDNSIQVVKISNSLVQVKNTQSPSLETISEDQDETLQYLPSKSVHQVSDSVNLDYIFLTGSFKGQKGNLSQDSLKLAQVKQVLQIQYIENSFYLPQYTKIYVKTANQVINGELSYKIPIKQGMKIILEECHFVIK